MYPVDLMEANMKSAILKFWRDEEGATAIEYGLIAALIAIAAVVAMGTLGDGISEIFERIAAIITSGDPKATGTK